MVPLSLERRSRTDLLQIAIRLPEGGPDLYRRFVPTKNHDSETEANQETIRTARPKQKIVASCGGGPCRSVADFAAAAAAATAARRRRAGLLRLRFRRRHCCSALLRRRFRCCHRPLPPLRRRRASSLAPPTSTPPFRCPSIPFQPAASPTPPSPPTSSLLIPPIAALPSSHRRQRRRGSAGWLARLLRRCIRRRRRRSSANLGSGQGGPKASASARRTPVARGHVARGQESPAGKRSVTSDGPLWFNKGFISTHHERDSCVAVRLQPPPPLKAARERTMAKDEPPRTTL